MQSFVYTMDPAAFPTTELVYPLATPEGHQTIRTAVVAAIMRLRPLSPVAVIETDEGVNAYYIPFCNVYVQVLLAQISERLANLQMSIVGKVVDSNKVQLIDESVLTPRIMSELATVYHTVDRHILDFLRKAYLLDELKPPTPPLEDRRALFYYQRIYFPHLDDGQFSELIDVPLPTLRNWRALAGMTQGNFRPVPIDWSLVRPEMTEEDVEEFFRRNKEQKRKRKERERELWNR